MLFPIFRLADGSAVSRYIGQTTGETEIHLICEHGGYQVKFLIQQDGVVLLPGRAITQGGGSAARDFVSAGREIGLFSQEREYPVSLGVDRLIIPRFASDDVLRVGTLSLPKEVAALPAGKIRMYQREIAKYVGEVAFDGRGAIGKVWGQMAPEMVTMEVRPPEELLEVGFGRARREWPMQVQLREKQARGLFREWYVFLFREDYGSMANSASGRDLPSAVKTLMENVGFVAESREDAWWGENSSPGKSTIDPELTSLYELLGEPNPYLWPTSRFLEWIGGTK